MASTTAPSNNNNNNNQNQQPSTVTMRSPNSVNNNNSNNASPKNNNTTTTGSSTRRSGNKKGGAGNNTNNNTRKNARNNKLNSSAESSNSGDASPNSQKPVVVINVDSSEKDLSVENNHNINNLLTEDGAVGGNNNNNNGRQPPLSPQASTSASKNRTSVGGSNNNNIAEQLAIPPQSNFNMSDPRYQNKGINNNNAAAASSSSYFGTTTNNTTTSSSLMMSTNNNNGGRKQQPSNNTSSGYNDNHHHHNNNDDHPKKNLIQQTLSFGISKEPLLRTQLAEKQAQLDDLTKERDRLERENQRLRRTQEEIQSNTGDQAVRMTRYQESMLEVMKESARTHRREARRAHHNKQFELGHQTIMSTPVGQREVWVHGNRMRELHAKLDEVTKRIEEVEADKADAEKKKKNQKNQYKQQKRESMNNAANNNNNEDGEDSNPGNSSNINNNNPLADSALFDYEEQIELRKGELSTLRQLETQLKSELEGGFSPEKVSFLKEKARLQYEDQSEFASVPAIGTGRYVLMYLLGKGGFSEVWRAFDLREGRHVACKIHRMRKEWSTAQRETYMRHARRELDIQRSLDHPRLTKLYDVFEYDPKENHIAYSSNNNNNDFGGNNNNNNNNNMMMNNSYNNNNNNNGAVVLQSSQISGESIFVSVMEYSAGDDLDSHLRRVRLMPEIDARIVFMQIVSCLRHLAEQKEPIIHYDLKPANILFHSALSTCMDIKITDFGLSKIIAEGTANDDNQIDITSPGAGTYWYLPPEAFGETTSSKISPKVDIWSSGVIFYQMLYGKRPFADGESQRKIWQDQLIIRNAAKLEFPDKPSVSEGAKNLIRRCLTPSEEDRPDIFQLSIDPYLREPSRRKRTNSAVTTGAGGSGAVGGGGMLMGNLLNGPRAPPQPSGGAPLRGGMEFKVPDAP